MMDKNFDFERIGKKTPYRVPDGFFIEMENNILKQVKPHPAVRAVHKRRTLIRWGIQAVACAAVIAFMMTVSGGRGTKSKADSFASVEQSFARLSAEDQAYLLQTYQDDIFINE